MTSLDNPINTLSNKHILLGITGGIAAYKCAELIRQLQAMGAKVRVVMTQSAEAFVTPLTLQALSRSPVYLSEPPNVNRDSKSQFAMDHIELARWADWVLIAPTSAHCMAKLAHGLADDLLSTLCLATTAPLVLAPAMNQAMWRHPSTQANKTTLEKRGVVFWGPAEGVQACQEIGPGRMLEPEVIAALAANYSFPWVASSGPCPPRNDEQIAMTEKISVIITAGPTHEPIDPVRYISNRSSGKMGYALAEAAAKTGAKVTLISGPTYLTPPAHVTCINVTTADEMLSAVQQNITPDAIFISAAAVADFRLAEIAPQKIKKSAVINTGTDTNTHLTLSLVPNTDIVATVAALADRPAYVVGFAAETENLEANAREKLERKQLDLIVANAVNQTDRGFDADDNAALLLWADGKQALSLKSKAQLAEEIITFIVMQCRHKSEIAKIG